MYGFIYEFQPSHKFALIPASIEGDNLNQELLEIHRLSLSLSLSLSLLTRPSKDTETSQIVI